MSKLLQRVRDELATVNGLGLGLLFGSRAKGTAHEGSDLDLAVDLPACNLGQLAAQLSENLGLEVDLVRLQDASIPLLRELIAHSIVIYQGRPGSGALWRSRVLVQLELDGPWHDRMRDAWIAQVASHGLTQGK